MTASGGLETFLVGLVCGCVFGAVGMFSRRILGLVLGLGAAAIVFVIVDRGMGGIEGAVRRILDGAMHHQHLVAGAVAGAVLAATFLNRGACRRDGGDR